MLTFYANVTQRCRVFSQRKFLYFHPSLGFRNLFSVHWKIHWNFHCEYTKENHCCVELHWESAGRSGRWQHWVQCMCVNGKDISFELSESDLKIEFVPIKQPSISCWDSLFTILLADTIGKNKLDIPCEFFEDTTKANL